jgi:hypothetical protein
LFDLRAISELKLGGPPSRAMTVFGNAQAIPPESNSLRNATKFANIRLYPRIAGDHGSQGRYRQGVADVAAGRVKSFDTKRIVARGKKLLAGR